MAPVYPPPEGFFNLREGDERLTADELATLSLFKTVTRIKKLPGSVILRRCEPGRVMCRQMEAGASAFLVVTTDDLLELRKAQRAYVDETLQAMAAGTPRQEMRPFLREMSEQELRARADWLDREIPRLEQRNSDLAEAENKRESGTATAVKSSDTFFADDPRVVASARLLVDLHPTRPKRGLLHRLVESVFRSRPEGEDLQSNFIANDGPSSIDPNTLRAPIREGELFGEMSCLNRTPRSATVITEYPCYMIEMLGNVLDILRSNPEYKAHVDEIYRRRMMGMGLRNFSVFRQLSDDQFKKLTDTVKLVEFPSGAVIFEQHEPSDCFYLIRSGLVKVVVNNCWLLRRDDVVDGKWQQLSRELQEAGASAEAPCRLTWELLGPELSPLLDGISSEPDAAQQNAILEKLNEFVRSGQAHMAADPKNPAERKHRKTRDLVALLDDDEFELELATYPDETQDWTGVQVRTFHRLLLERALSSSLRRRSDSEPARRSLAYLGQGEFIGEMGVLADEPRNATCIAYDHPEFGQKHAGGAGLVVSRVEMVRIDKTDFRRLMDESPELRRTVEAEVANRQRNRELRMQRGIGGQSPSLLPTEDFDDLGLIQGQQLMLIDLDRCTRCGACVEACVDAHTDGQTRLYLDGPQFGKYLVPSTCRKCLDPVCMIGCPVRAIVRGDDNEIRILNHCIGCHQCADQCPYGSIKMVELEEPLELTDYQKQLLPADVTANPVPDKAVVCDMCQSHPSRDPACVYACPHDAALRIDGRRRFSELFLQELGQDASRRAGAATETAQTAGKTA